MLHYQLQGKTLNFTSAPDTVYLGLPELWCLETKTKVERPLLAKPVQSPSDWQALTGGEQGIYELCLQDEHGDFVFHVVCALLPEDFSISFLPIARRIDLRHSERAYVSCDSPLVTVIQATVTARSIELNQQDALPDSIAVTFRWTGCQEKLVIQVPCKPDFAPVNTKTEIVVNHDELDALCQENAELNTTINQLTNTLKKRETDICLLLDEIKQINLKIQTLRAALQSDNYLD